MKLPLIPLSREYGIPATLHQIWVGGTVPMWVKKNWTLWEDQLEETSEYDWTYLRWTDKSIVGSPLQVPLEICQDAGMSARGTADILRIYALGYFGGMYMDSDLLPLRSFDDIVLSDVQGWMLSTDNPESDTDVFCNGMLAFAKGHDLLSRLRDHAQEALERGVRNDHYVAGPRAWRTVLEGSNVFIEWDMIMKDTAQLRRAVAEGADVDLAALREIYPARVAHVFVPEDAS